MRSRGWYIEVNRSKANLKEKDMYGVKVTYTIQNTIVAVHLVSNGLQLKLKG